MDDDKLREIEDWVNLPSAFNVKADLEDARTYCTLLLAEVRRLQKELAEHHCESCDGSAKECGGPL